MHRAQKLDPVGKSFDGVFSFFDLKIAKIEKSSNCAEKIEKSACLLVPMRVM